MKVKLGLVGFILLSSAIAYKMIYNHGFSELITNSTLTVGDKIPPYAAITYSKIDFEEDIPKGKFYFYLVSSTISKYGACLDLECGPEVQTIRELGGRFQGIRGPKHAELVFGVKLVKDSPNFEYSLLVIANENGTIIKMFKNVTIEDIPTVLELLKKQNFLSTL